LTVALFDRHGRCRFTNPKLVIVDFERWCEPQAAESTPSLCSTIRFNVSALKAA
jgi:hypothetical protein